MSSDPQPFEEDLESLEPQTMPDETTEPAPSPGKKKQKRSRLKRDKVKKVRPTRSSSGGAGVFFREQFPDVYTTLLGIAALAIVIACILLAIEFWGRYGGERKPTRAMATPPAAVEKTVVWVAS